MNFIDARQFFASGYQMVDSFTIRNFRSFNEAKVEDCKRFNILVGDNGSGKTALLEALFLAGGISPEIVLRTRIWRGAEMQNLSCTEEDLHAALWDDLFFKFSTNHAAVISLRGKGEHTRSVTVNVNPPGSRVAIPPSRSRPGSQPQVVPNEIPIEFRWEIRGSNPVTVRPAFQGGRLVVPSVPGRHVRAAFFAANQTVTSQETAARFSSLSSNLTSDRFVSRFIDIFPDILDASLELSGGIPMLFAEVKGLKRKIPLPLASGGANKLAAILLAIAQQNGGIVIVDEIENGFYYKKMPMIWSIIADFCREYDCQLLASTHSAECLEAASKLAEKSPDEFCLLQAYMEHNETKIVRLPGTNFAYAVAENIEVR